MLSTQVTDIRPTPTASMLASSTDAGWQRQGRVWWNLKEVCELLRFPAAWPPKPLSIGTQLFAHVVLVGLPTAFIAKRYLRG